MKICVVSFLMVCGIIKRKLWIIIKRSNELAHKAAADDRDTQKLISELGTVADELGEQLSLTHEIPDMPTATAEAMARVREIRERVARGGTAGIHTGLGGLDRLMGGLRTGSLHVFAARPGMGKTAFALFMAVNAAKQGVPVCVYSLEMSREQLIFRMLGQIAEWSLRRSPREPPPRRR